MKTQLTTVLALTMLATAPVGCANKTDDAPTVEEQPRPVRFERIMAGARDGMRTYQGTVGSSAERSLSFRVSGNVQAVSVNVGDEVAQGDPIATIETTDLQLQVQQAQAQRGQLAAQLSLAQSQLARTQRLYEGGNASISDLDVASTQVETARASVASIDQQIQLLNRQAGYGRLTAPSAGVISSVRLEVGENVAPGTTVVTMEGEDDGALEVDIAVPEGDIAGFERGQRAEVRVPALPDATLDATVTEVGVSTSQGARTYPVTLTLAGDTSGLRPGMTAEATITGGRERQAPSVELPPSAVSADGEGTFVWVVEPTGPEVGTAHRRAVEAGELTDDSFSITSGLEDGEIVITAGLRFLSEGQEITLSDRYDATPDARRAALDAMGSERTALGGEE